MRRDSHSPRHSSTHARLAGWQLLEGLWLEKIDVVISGDTQLCHVGWLQQRYVELLIEIAGRGWVLKPFDANGFVGLLSDIFRLWYLWCCDAQWWKQPFQNRNTAKPFLKRLCFPVDSKSFRTVTSLDYPQIHQKSLIFGASLKLPWNPLKPPSWNAMVCLEITQKHPSLKSFGNFWNPLSNLSETPWNFRGSPLNRFCFSQKPLPKPETPYEVLIRLETPLKHLWNMCEELAINIELV